MVVPGPKGCLDTIGETEVGIVTAWTTDGIVSRLPVVRRFLEAHSLHVLREEGHVIVGKRLVRGHSVCLTIGTSSSGSTV